MSPQTKRDTFDPELPISLLVDAADQTRTHYKAEALEELAASIRQHGIVSPLLVRPLDADGKALLGSGTAHKYEIGAGHRRKRAAVLAGLEVVPVRIRMMSDNEFVELITIENLQREELHPLDEAAGYHRIMGLDPAYTVEAVAARVGKSKAYVYRRLKLLELAPAARHAYEVENITAAHAERLARLTPEQQERALRDACYRPLLTAGAQLTPDERGEPEPVSELDAWIERHVRERPESPDVAAYFPEVAEALEQLAASAVPPTLVELSEDQFVNRTLGDTTHGALGKGRWTEVRKDRKADRCKHVERGLVVHGGPMRVVEFCRTKGCAKHYPERPANASSGARSSSADAAGARQRESMRRYEIEAAVWKERLPEFLALMAAAGAKLSADEARERALALHGDERKKIAEVLGVDAVHSASTFASALAVRDALRNGYNIDNATYAAERYGVNLKPLRATIEKEVKARLAPNPAKAAKPAKGKTSTAKRTLERATKKGAKK